MFENCDAEDQNVEEGQVVFQADRKINEEVEGMINMEGSTTGCVWRRRLLGFAETISLFDGTRQCSKETI